MYTSKISFKKTHDISLDFQNERMAKKMKVVLIPLTKLFNWETLLSASNIFSGW